MAERDSHYRLTPVETPKDKKKEMHDEITREIARYLAMGKEIKQIPSGQGAGSDERNF